MKLTTNRKQLLTALDMVSGAIDKKMRIQILHNVMLSAGEGYLSLTATDLELAVQTGISADVETAGVLTIPFLTAQKFVKAMKADYVTIESDTEVIPCGFCTGTGCAPFNGTGPKPKCLRCDGLGQDKATRKLKLSAGLASITIEGTSIDSYPTIPTWGNKAFPTVPFLDIDSAAWLEMVSKVRYAISREESRLTLNGFLLDVNGAVRMVATDGHRLSLVQRGETCDSPHTRAIIPARCADQLKRIFGKGNHSLSILKTVIPSTKDDKGHDVYPTQYWIVRSGDTTVSGRILTGNFPDYERVMPHYEGQYAKLSASDLLAGIDAVYHAANERNHAIKVEFNCTTVKLSASTVEGSAASIEVPCETGMCHGVTVGLNAEYLRQFVATLPKSDDVYISCDGHQHAAPAEMYERGEISLTDMDEREQKRISAGGKSSWGFTAGSDFNYRHVIMPMRVD